MTTCPKCGSRDLYDEPLFPSEQMDDLHYECLECGCEWDEFVEKKITVVITKDGDIDNIKGSSNGQEKSNKEEGGKG